MCFSVGMRGCLECIIWAAFKFITSLNICLNSFATLKFLIYVPMAYSTWFAVSKSRLGCPCSTLFLKWSNFLTFPPFNIAKHEFFRIFVNIVNSSATLLLWNCKRFLSKIGFALVPSSSQKFSWVHPFFNQGIFWFWYAPFVFPIYREGGNTCGQKLDYMSTCYCYKMCPY